MANPITRLTNKLVSLGLPIQCVNDIGVPPAHQFVAILTPGSTPAQQTQADAAIASYVDAPRVAYQIAEIIAQINALTPANQTKLSNICQAVLILQYPAIGASVGVFGDHV